MQPTIKKLAFHRNGVAGEGFNVAIAKHEGRDMLLVTFPDVDAGGMCCTAAFDLSLLDQRIIGMFEGPGNAWRGDHYHNAMMQAIGERTERDKDGLLVAPKK